MDIIGLIKSALLALTAFLELKSKAFYYDIMQKSRTRQKELINEIEKFKDKTVDELKQIRDEMLEICEHNRLNYLQMVTYKYTFNGDSMNNHKEIQSLINQIKLGII